MEATVEQPKTQLTEFNQIEEDALNFLLTRNLENSEIYDFYLLTPSYSLQFPDHLRQSVNDQTDVDVVDQDEGLMIDPETPSQYWLDSDQIIESLAYLDFEQIYHDLVDSRPFVTVETFKETIIEKYQKAYQNNSCWVKPEYITEYVTRFFNGLGQGRINWGNDKFYKIAVNKFNQLVISD